MTAAGVQPAAHTAVKRRQKCSSPTSWHCMSWRRAVRRGDLVGPWEEEGVPDRSEEAGVARDVLVSAVGRVLEEHRRRTSRTANGILQLRGRPDHGARHLGLAVVENVAERFMEREDITPLDH